MVTKPSNRTSKYVSNQRYQGHLVAAYDADIAQSSFVFFFLIWFVASCQNRDVTLH